MDHADLPIQERGFTLVEVLAALSLTLILAVTAFALLQRVRDTRSRLEARFSREMEMYRILEALGAVMGGISSVPGDASTEFPLFRGERTAVEFITRTPLISPVPGLHRIRLLTRDNRLLVWEERWPGPSSAGDPGAEWATDPIALIENIDQVFFQYRIWDSSGGGYRWTERIDCLEGKPLPRGVALNFAWEGEKRRVEWPRRLTDEYNAPDPSRIP